MARSQSLIHAASALALDHPAIATATVITGLLLRLPDQARTKVLRIVEQQLTLTLDDDSNGTPRELQPELFGGGDERLRLHDGDSTRDTGE